MQAIQAGGKPSKATPKDRRLTENKPPATRPMHPYPKPGRGK